MFKPKSLIEPEAADPYSNKKPPDPVREFYLEPNKSYQYLPKDRLNFSNSRLLLYQSRKTTFKFLYLPKVLLPIITAFSLAISSSLLSSALLLELVIISSLGLSLSHSLFACRLLKAIHLHENGENVDLTFRVLQLFSYKTTHAISDFRDQRMGFLMYMWSLHPIPKNLLAGIESEFSELLPMYLKKPFGFYLLHGKPQISHQDVLMNVLNGVSINTKAYKARVNFYRERYQQVSK
jgi:hypothetical protein